MFGRIKYPYTLTFGRTNPDVYILYKLTKACSESVITRKLRALKGPQVRTITRYGTGSVILFNCAERNSLVKQSEQSPTDIVSTGDSVQTGSHDTFLSRFALSYGMTQRIGTEVLCVNMYIVTHKKGRKCISDLNIINK
ncbi:MAG: hypothetical protein J6T63_01580 [Bacteroidales bacterium]|nr:hypothetical protein [Bacteroidales bacterium]